MLLGENSGKQNKIYSIMPLRKAKITHIHTHTQGYTMVKDIHQTHKGHPIGEMKKGKETPGGSERSSVMVQE